MDHMVIMTLPPQPSRPTFPEFSEHKVGQGG